MSPTPYFTGREPLLARLHKYFDSKSHSCHTAFLTGSGGSGKTEMALKFIQLCQMQNRFTDVFFVNATDTLTLENGLRAIVSANSAGISVQDALGYLTSRKDEWLLFLDNADDPSVDLRPYLAWSHGNVLVTTRHSTLHGHAPPTFQLRVDRLEIEEAKELLLKEVAFSEDLVAQNIAYDIVQELGCLALAVAQARAYLAYGICSLDVYLSIYKQNRQKLLEDSRTLPAEEYKNSVHTTWTISFNKLSEEAKILFQLLCFMHHEDIISEIFELAWQRIKQSDEDITSTIPHVALNFLLNFRALDFTWDTPQFQNLTQELMSFSLVGFNNVNHTYSLHPLIQQWAQHLFSDHYDIIQATQTLLSLAAPAGESEEHYSLRKALLPHLRESFRHGIFLHYTFLHSAGQIYREGGLFSESSEIYEKELREKRQILGSEHPHTLMSMNNLSSTYSYLGRHQDALQLVEQVVELNHQILGSEHPDTMMSMNNLAMTYSDLGKHRNALPLMEQVNGFNMRVHGPEHSDTLIGLNNLAATYSALGRYLDALRLDEQVMGLYQRLLGSEHPDTLMSMNNLAVAYSRLGRHLDALHFNERVVSLRTKILGPDHPSTLSSMSNLASTYSNLGRHQDALQLKGQLVELNAHILGSEHPAAVASMSSLASTYSDLGRHLDALQMKERVVELNTRILGSQHPDTITSMSNLASTFSDLERHQDALQLKRQVVELNELVLGSEHPNTIISMKNLASTFSDLGHHQDSLQLQEQVVKLCVRVLVPEHPITVMSLNSIASTHPDLNLQDAGSENTASGNAGVCPLGLELVSAKELSASVKHEELKEN
ncbi:P-loop containing nucleoside triphosphate hydrolase protein [Flagelloscypha sp. PMI_526]|nr:P-loop containing nucleoside triphosphate hydrolase protein [Flagelloscypha sp. PMI_526]